MFEHTSRYESVSTAVYTSADGREIEYKTRRWLPRGASLPALGATRVHDSERLDLVAARTIGDPEQFWRICDANDALDPFDLVTRPGRVLRIPRAYI